MGNALLLATASRTGRRGGAFSKSWGNRLSFLRPSKAPPNARGDFPGTALPTGSGGVRHRREGTRRCASQRGRGSGSPAANECSLGAPGGRVWEGARPSHERTTSRNRHSPPPTNRSANHLTGFPTRRECRFPALRFSSLHCPPWALTKGRRSGAVLPVGVPGRSRGEDIERWAFGCALAQRVPAWRPEFQAVTSSAARKVPLRHCRGGWVERAISTASRRSMPARGRRSELSSAAREVPLRHCLWRWVERAISTASRRSMPARGRRSELSSAAREVSRRLWLWGWGEGAISTASRRSMPAWRAAFQAASAATEAGSPFPATMGCGLAVRHPQYLGVRALTESAGGCYAPSFRTAVSSTLF